MAMKICKECGSEVSSKGVCPKCGKDQRNFFTKHKVVTFLLVVIILGAIVGGTSENNNNNNATQTGTSITQEQKKMTLEKFNKIETGMTYQQVVDIAGEDGTLSTESSYGSQSMQVYYWYASNGISNATVSFMNGKVTAKSQIGLE